MIKILCGMALMGWLLLDVAPAFAGQATLSGTAPKNDCLYSQATLKADDGSLTITCGETSLQTAIATLKNVNLTQPLSCDYKTVEFSDNGALTVTCTKAPVCTLSADPAPAGGVTANTVVTLTASCAPAPISYTWGNASGCSGATCKVSPTTTTTYNVTGSNSDGAGSPASVTVTVNSTAMAAPVCTLTPLWGDTTFTPGNGVQLTANCTPAATSYVWTGGSCAGTRTTAVCSDTPTTTTTYTVIASNDKGPDSKRSVTMTPSGTTTPTPVPAISCSLTASPSTSIAPGAQVTLSASCSPGATSYVWTGGACVGQTASSCTVTPATTTSYGVTGSNASATAAPKTVTVTVNAPASTAPVCTLTPLWGDTTFTPGNGVQLTANCTPAATSYVWTGGSCAGTKTTAVCSDTPTTTTTYTVIASNDKGPDSKRSVTMTPSGTTPSSQCSLTADPTSVVVGQPYTLTGQCGASQVLNGQWSGEGCTTQTGWTCTVTSKSVGSFSYSVQLTVGAGNKYTAATSVTVTASASASKPVCTLTASPLSVTSGSPVTLTASCNPAGTYTYTWSDTSCAGTSASCTVTPTVDTTYSVKGSNSGGESDLQSVSVKVIPAAAASYQGLWWNPQESGWGISVTQHSDKIFAAIYTYDDKQQPTWYSLSDCPILAAKTNGCKGDIYKLTGGSSPLVEPWTKPANTLTQGTGTFTFSDASHGKFDYTLNGVAGSKQIEKFTFAGSTQPFATDYTNLWMKTGEDGWGVALTQDKGMLFAAWYAYNKNTDGTPAWYFSTCTLTGNATDSSCYGRLLRRTGGVPLTSPWTTITTEPSDEGSVVFTFSSTTQGEMVFTPKTGTTVMRKTITPFGF